MAGRITSNGTKFLSTLSLRRATKRLRQKLAEAIISIHALLAESDPATGRNDQNNMISIHALLAESDRIRKRNKVQNSRFLSTLSLRRATESRYKRTSGSYISIHALLAESDEQAKSLKIPPLCISIHALLAESDWYLRQL